MRGICLAGTPGRSAEADRHLENRRQAAFVADDHGLAIGWHPDELSGLKLFGHVNH